MITTELAGPLRKQQGRKLDRPAPEQRRRSCRLLTAERPPLSGSAIEGARRGTIAELRPTPDEDMLSEDASVGLARRSPSPMAEPLADAPTGRKRRPRHVGHHEVREIVQPDRDDLRSAVLLALVFVARASLG